MKKELVTKLHHAFEATVNQQEDVEFWYARDLQKLLGYTEWRNFLLVVDKAKQACENSKQRISNHFVDVNKMVPLGSGSSRGIEDIKLTRYACYLIAQNGDPRKNEIAFCANVFRSTNPQARDNRTTSCRSRKNSCKRKAQQFRKATIRIAIRTRNYKRWICAHSQQRRSSAVWRPKYSANEDKLRRAG